MKKVSVLGSGTVGDVLSNAFLALGYPVIRGSRDPGKLAGWKSSAKGDASTGTFAEAAAAGEIVVLAVKGTGAESAVEAAGAANLAGKLVIDATNPIADAPPKNGALRYFTGADESLVERLQAKAPAARFVKAFNSVGSAVMFQPKLGATPSMFMCGADAAAKQEAAAIVAQFGYEAIDVGGIEMGHAVEALCILWCATGFLHNDWVHALRYLKA